MTAPVNILLLGLGGNVSQGILKALRKSQLPLRIIGGCVRAEAAGLYFCDHALVTPYATDPHFINWLITTCNQFQIHGILTGVEEILIAMALHQKALQQNTTARVISSSYERLEICHDKLKTAHWLKANGLNYPKSVDAGNEADVLNLLNDLGLPLFAKPKVGKGAKGAMRIDSIEQLNSLRGNAEYVIQEFLPEQQNEITAASFSDIDGEVRGIILFKRDLQNGTTVCAQVTHSPIVEQEVMRISQRLKPSGPCNMQLRMHRGKPVCFEINLRYSGTAPIRAELGFNDVEAGIRHYILGEPAYDLAKIRNGFALRFWNEVYLDEQSYTRFQSKGSFENPAQSIQQFEQFGRKQ
ncbi:MAG: ATP-grasp domain-containing protein [Planctomycetia bacterium]|nr:ATP-grasp domain-containing protein [Planctomycetia bacterium]